MILPSQVDDRDDFNTKGTPAFKIAADAGMANCNERQQPVLRPAAAGSLVSVPTQTTPRSAH
jgi:hypothetical protein